MDKHSSIRSRSHIHVLIIEDHPLFREGLEKALSLEQDMRVLGYTESGTTALQMARELKPDVLLLDVNLPDMNGMQVARQIRQENPDIAIVLLTAYHDDQQTLYAMRSGASAYCSKSIDPRDLVQIIRDTTAGLFVINNQRLDLQALALWIQEHVLAASPHLSDNIDTYYSPLSPRETEILRAVTHGMRNKEIAQQFGISQQTVKNHMTSILRKLNVGDRTEAAVTALRAGWVRMKDR